MSLYAFSECFLHISDTFWITLILKRVYSLLIWITSTCTTYVSVTEVVAIPIFCPVHQSENPGSVTLASCGVQGCSARSWERSSPRSEWQLRAIRTRWITWSQLAPSGAILCSVYLIRTGFARYQCLETSRSGEALCCAWASVKVAFFLVIVLW